MTTSHTINTLKRRKAYTKATSAGALFALNAIDPHNVSASVHLQVVIFRRSSNPNFSIVKPTNKKHKHNKSVQKMIEPKLKKGRRNSLIASNGRTRRRRGGRFRRGGGRLRRGGRAGGGSRVL